MNKTVSYKTVAVFAGLTQKKLWLKDAPRPSTDGHEICVPLQSEHGYLYLEEQLAHILFRTSATAKRLFIERYSAKVAAAAKQLGADVSERELAVPIAHIITVLELKRVLSLWARLYEGSAELLEDLHQQDVQPLLPQAHESLLTYFTCVALCPAETPSGHQDAFRSILEEGVRRVLGRGFLATLATAKWLVMRLVDQLIEEAKQQPPQGGSGGSEGGEGEEAPGAERAEALEGLLGMMGDRPSCIRDPVMEPNFQSAADWEAAKMADAAIRSTGSERELEGTGKAMDGLIARAQEALRQQMERGAWLQQDAMARINFLEPKLPKEIPALSVEDLDTVRSLRALFYRVMGKRRMALEDGGTEIDIPAYLEQRLTGIPGPVFRTDGVGRGFRVHLLLDRSSSMQHGHKTEQCQRACRIIKRALAFPFVNLSVWGFSSFEAGSITLTRYDTAQEIFIKVGDKGEGGSTPLHIAMRLAVKELQTSNDAKQLIAITDGFPTHATKSGYKHSTKQLMGFTRETVRKARQQGINVTGVILGAIHPDWWTKVKKHGHADKRYTDEKGNPAYYDLSEQDLGYMFGSNRNWRCLHPDRIGHGLVELIASSFVSFLRAR